MRENLNRPFSSGNLYQLAWQRYFSVACPKSLNCLTDSAKCQKSRYYTHFCKDSKLGRKLTRFTSLNVCSFIFCRNISLLIMSQKWSLLKMTSSDILFKVNIMIFRLLKKWSRFPICTLNNTALEIRIGTCQLMSF